MCYVIARILQSCSRRKYVQTSGPPTILMRNERHVDNQAYNMPQPYHASQICAMREQKSATPTGSLSPLPSGTHSELLALPLELRQQILSYLVTVQAPLQVAYFHAVAPGSYVYAPRKYGNSSIYRVCKQVAAEALEMSYRLNSVHLDLRWEKHGTADAEGIEDNARPEVIFKLPPRMYRPMVKCLSLRIFANDVIDQQLHGGTMFWPRLNCLHSYGFGYLKELVLIIEISGWASSGSETPVHRTQKQMLKAFGLHEEVVHTDGPWSLANPTGTWLGHLLQWMTGILEDSWVCADVFRVQLYGGNGRARKTEVEHQKKLAMLEGCVGLYKP